MIKNFLFHDLIPIKNISGGSGAETWVVKDRNDSVFVRKFASGEAGRKLTAQTAWLNDYRNRVFCPAVLNDGHIQDFYFYDMTYLASAETAFDKLATGGSATTLADITSALQEFKIAFEKLPVAKNPANREKYISEKFIKNIQNAKTNDPVFAELANAGELNINGMDYPGLSRLLENSIVKNVMKSVISENLYSAGHGDLTLSNLLIQDEKVAFIDPNPAFEYISQEQEYSKVLQSTLVKYELFFKLHCDVRNGRAIRYAIESSPDFTMANRAILASDAFKNLKSENLFLHLAIHLARILPYIKSENRMRSYVYLSEIIKLLNSVANGGAVS